ncbi:MAG TPA: energy transducer TonB, partial [Bacteroidia bacterium]
PPPPTWKHNTVGPADSNAVYNNAELTQQADFPGGMTELYRFLQMNIHYPQKERDQGIQGKVFITFVIEKDGSISDVTVIKGVPGGKALDDEAMRVIKMMPNWNPGRQDGKTVRVKYALPIKFTLGGDESPTFPGGPIMMKKYFSDNLEYPKSAKKHKLEGEVVVSFDVEPDGTVVNPVVRKSLGDGCDEEALRLVKNMPKWNPGSNKTKNYSTWVNVKFELPK